MSHLQDQDPPSRRDLRDQQEPRPARHRARVIRVVAAMLPVAVVSLGAEQLHDHGLVWARLARTPGHPAGYVDVGTPPLTPAAEGPAPLSPAAEGPSPSTARSAAVPAAGGRPRIAVATPARRTVTPPSPAAGLRADPQQLRDLAYATTSHAQVLDLYLPRRTGTAVPLLIYVHGGAFSGGDKRDRFPQFDTLVARGYAVASLNYRLSGEARFPAAVQDVKAAVRWLRASATRYGIDPRRFGAWGDSAGGYLVTMLGVTGDQHTLFDDATLGHGTVSSAVQAVVDWYGPTDFLAMDAQSANTRCPEPQVHDDAGSPESVWLGAPLKKARAEAHTANPITYVPGARALPPFLVAHGDADCNVPHGQSQLLVTALRARHAEVTFTLLPGATHGDPVFQQQVTPAIAFLDKALAS